MKKLLVCFHQKRHPIVCSLGLSVWMAAGAGTIVHYHLDELSAGTRGTSSTTFVNAANPGTHDGHAVAYVLGADGTTITEATEQPSLFPRGAESFPEGIRYLDPVSGALHDAVRAVAFEGAAADALVSGGGIQTDAVPVTDDFTVEAFCRAADWHAGQPDAATVANEQAVFGLMTGWKQSTFECRLTSANRLVFVSWCEHSNWKKSTVEVSVADGKWHHVAYSYNGARRDLLGYFDYALVYSNRLDETEVLVRSQSASLYLGVNPKQPAVSALTGGLSEFRLSDEALEPASFLRAVRGDGVAFAWLSAFPTDDSLPGIRIDRPNAQYTVSDDVDGTVVYDGLLGTGVTGRKSYHFDAGDRATGQSGGFIVFDEARNFSVGSFTAEVGFKFAQGAWKDFPEEQAALLAQNLQWTVSCDRTRGRLIVSNGKGEWVMTIGAEAWDDGAWHRLAVASDRANGETRLYLDGRLVDRKDGVMGDLVGQLSPSSDAWRRISVNSMPWELSAMNRSCRAGFFNDIRFTRRALRPCELLTTRHVAGDTLAWASFDRADAWEAECVEPSAWTGAATFVRTKAGVVSDADGNPLRERNGGSLSLASGGLAASRLSLLERADQTVELFLMGSADAGTDLVSFTGFRGGTANRTAHAVWSLRATAEGLKVYVGDTAVASAGALPGAVWSHVAVAFAPSADGSETAVTVYRDHAVAGTGTFAGTLNVDGLSDSSLALGAFAGQVDELRVSRGALGPSRLLRAVRRGLVLTIR